MGLHKAIFNQISIYFNGLIEPANEDCDVNLRFLEVAGFMTHPCFVALHRAGKAKPYRVTT
jgi:hypothetical protein